MTLAIDCQACGQAYEVRSAKPISSPTCPSCQHAIEHPDARRDDEPLDELALAVVNRRRRRP
jgi:hypothetical protein